MPVQVKCSCGKVLKVRDELAGKAVKCPGCQSVLRVPAAGQTGSPAAKPAKPAKPAGAAKRAGAPPPPSNDLDDLFQEAGFEQRAGKVCPKCFGTISPDAVLCTHCGFHLQTGSRVQGFEVEFDSTNEGARMLRKAETNMASEASMQHKLVSGSGMPWWMLMLVLFLLGSAVGIGAVLTNIRKAGEDAAPSNFDAIDTALMLLSIAFGTLGGGALLNSLYRAARYRRLNSYIRPLLLTIVSLAICGGAIAYRNSR